MAGRHLIPLQPDLFQAFACPHCQATDVKPQGSAFIGIHVFGQYVCQACNLEFYRDLPVGFAVDHPLAISTEGKLYGVTEGWEWISDPIIEGFQSKNNDPVTVERKVLKPSKDVVVLNTLDYLYGHVLLKLYNAEYYLRQYPEKGLVLILPKMFEWLVPEGVAEVWLVHQRLSEARGWHSDLDATIQRYLQDYRSVELGMGFAHPEFSGMDIEPFSGVKPFPMEEFTQKPPHITFVARQDRIWFQNRLVHLAYRAVRKLGLKESLGRFALTQQNLLMKRSMALIRTCLPNASFTVVGLGRSSGFGNGVEDLRTFDMNDEIERRWCRAYAKSQVVVGVHGSNMLLPTAHAAGCVEILPDDRFRNIVQDISVRYQDRMQLFLYRFVDEYASPKTIAKHVCSMFKDFNVYYRDNRTNTFENTEHHEG